MGTSFVVHVIMDVSADDLRAQYLRHAALYAPRPSGAVDVDVYILSGRHGSAIWSPTSRCPGMFLYPIGQQLAARWLDVRCVDSDTWTLNVHSGLEHICFHDVNPWAHDDAFVYDERTHAATQRRIQRIGALMPQYAESMAPYLLLWRRPLDLARPRETVARTGKARESDRHEYGDGDQCYDFLSCYGFADINWDVAFREKISL